jgi:hypothetical protein
VPGKTGKPSCHFRRLLHQVVFSLDFPLEILSLHLSLHLPWTWRLANGVVFAKLEMGEQWLNIL